MAKKIDINTALGAAVSHLTRIKDPSTLQLIAGVVNALTSASARTMERDLGALLQGKHICRCEKNGKHNADHERKSRGRNGCSGSCRGCHVTDELLGYASLG